jgi:hypothetical protein
MINNKSRWTFFSVGTLLATIMVACTNHVEPDRSLPSSHIAESEQVVIPAEIDLPANSPNGNSRVATYFARGVQKYKARGKEGTNPVLYDWVFVAPEADLYDATNTKVGTHFAGPSWQIAGTNALLVGQAYAPPRTVNKDPNSIDWLLLMPKSGTVPTGIFQKVNYIQRIVTTGGRAPATPPATATETIDVPYTAMYRFSKMNP